jgi:hypothetical protein
MFGKGQRVRSMVLKRMDDHGQSNIDFLFGLAIFLATFIYAVSFIPGLFAPYQPSSIDLSSVAYRTGVILVEDPGWYIYDSINGYGLQNWETNIADLNDSTKGGRIGLADNSLDKSTPNVLSIDKINALNNANTADSNYIPYKLVRDKIGLNGSVIYDFNLNITMNNTMTHKNVEILNRTSDQSQGGANIEYMDRVVMIDTGKELVVDCNNPDDLDKTPSPYLWISISDMSAVQRQSDMKIRIFNTSASYGNITIIGVEQSPGSPNPGPLIDPDKYTITINGVPKDLAHAVFNSTDIVEITVSSEILQKSGITAIAITTTSSLNSPPNSLFPQQIIDYENDPTYYLENICYPGIMKLEVWTGGLAS